MIFLLNTDSTASSITAEQILTERDIHMIMLLIHNFSHKWNDIGLGLGFLPSELDQIRNNLSLLVSSPTGYMTKLLSQWVQWPTVDHPTKPTLRALCETLRSAIVGLGSLAGKVEREMMYSANAGKGMYIAESCYPCPQVSLVSRPLSFFHLQEKKKKKKTRESPGI